MLEPDCFLRYHFSAATRNFTSGKSDVYVSLLAVAAKSPFNMVLFTEPVRRRNTFVGGIHMRSTECFQATHFTLVKEALIEIGCVVTSLVVGWLVVTGVHCGQTVHPRPIVTMEH